MKQYLEIINNIIQDGQWKDNRTGIRCKTTFCEIFRHNMADGFPLLTTRKVPWKSLRVELEGFIRGVTDKQWYQDRGCRYWDYWANPVSVNAELHNAANNPQDYPGIQSEDLKNHIQKEEKDLGPIYGYQWRQFGEHYGSLDGPEHNAFYDLNGIKPNEGVDQLKRIIDTLQTNPDDRRMICSAWNPNQMHLMALPPCHLLWNIQHVNGTLNLVWFQRSCDLMLGVPSNIASYGLLLELICRHVGMIPGELVGILSDCHIYENHMDGAKEQLQRNPRELPRLSLPKRLDIFDWTYDQVQLDNYHPHPKIDMGGVAV